ncbi:metallophosphoesterase [Pseudomonas viridiflava]|uniref:metallophosphoesterase n=1 Tax=Pseudomonas viridiflava TaxID=33069 RepID=UPI002B1E4945|nr:metallophosphoesterase [Pseudomonas viridiflava]
MERLQLTPHLLKLPQNLVDRDFVVGGIHFKARELHKRLLALGFDKSVDRLIAEGDFIDRGLGMLDGLKLLGKPWFFTVKGNHEQMLIDAYRANLTCPTPLMERGGGSRLMTSPSP